jgi:hypothetical protein
MLFWGKEDRIGQEKIQIIVDTVDSNIYLRQYNSRFCHRPAGFEKTAAGNPV